MADDVAIGPVVDQDTGWSFYGVLEEPGLGYVIQDLTHDGHLCAGQIRIERILIGSHYDPKTYTNRAVENFTLGSSRVKRVGDPKLIRLDKTATDPRGFYNPRLAVSVSYTLDKVFGEDEQQMTIEHRTLFTAYTKDTFHEPGGLLRAARIYPMIKFSAPRIPSGKELKDPYKRVAAIRVLYRLKFNVEGPKLGNQAGIFRDQDDISLKGAAVDPAGSIIFMRAEKPLISEVVGRGVVPRPSVKKLGGDKAGWDNIHQWNEQFKNKQEFLDAAKNDKFAATPGLPYGVHQHWRWGALFFKGMSPILDPGPQFGGLGLAGGPMIDPKLPDQLLEFGITQSGLREQRVLKILDDPSGMRFDYPLELMFASPSTEPENISLGVALATWIDITGFSKYVNEEPPFTNSQTSSFEGTLFTHGVFFAHESFGDLPFFKRQIELPFAHRPQYVPGLPTPSRWRRS